MGKLIWILFFAFCLISVHGSDEREENEESEDSEEDEEQGSGEAAEDDSDESVGEDADKKFECNLKYKRIGCYADKGRKDKPLATFMESDDILAEDMDKKSKTPDPKNFNGELPKFACKCANDAIEGGNAIFGLQNLAECWTGPDDSQYDKDGESEDCVTFDFAKCSDSSEVCAGKKHANFMYYVDVPEHTKTTEEITQELADNAKEEAKTKKSKKSKKKSKKSKH